jgi:predicted nucleic-acid-binding Zn-ribbon protein
MSGKCVKCGCADIIQRARVEAPQSDGLGNREVRIRVDARPEALLFREAAYSALRASVCPACGYMEFYATDAEELQQLHKAYLAAREAASSQPR